MNQKGQSSRIRTSRSEKFDLGGYNSDSNEQGNDVPQKRAQGKKLNLRKAGLKEELRNRRKLDFKNIINTSSELYYFKFFQFLKFSFLLFLNNGY